MRDFMIANHLCAPEKLVVLGSGSVSVSGIDTTNVFCPHRLSTQGRSGLRKQYGIDKDDFVIGFVGRLVRDKGLCELAAAWRTLRERHPKLHLMLVGPEESGDSLPAEDMQLFRTDPRVHLTGMVDNVAQQLAMMDVFVNPSYREGFGVANAEASAMALPVVSTRIPGCVDSLSTESPACWFHPAIRTR